MNVLTLTSRQNYARTLADSAGLTLVEEVGCKQPRTNGSSIFVPPYPINCLPNSPEEVEYFYLIIHESAHNAPFNAGDWDILRDKIHNKVAMSIHNINVDNNIELLEVSRGFTGRNSIIGQGNAMWFESMVADGLATNDTEALGHKMSALLIWDYALKQQYLPEMSVCSPIDLLHEDNQEWYDVLSNSEETVTAWLTINTPEVRWELTKSIIKLLKLEEETQLDEENDTAGKKPEKGEAGDEAEGEADGDGEPTDEEGESKGTVNATVKYSELLQHEHSKGTTKTPSHIKIEYDTMGSGHTPMNPSEFKVVDMTNPSNCYAQLGHKKTISAPFIERVVGASTLSKRIRRLVQVASRVKYTGGKRRGKIKAKNLHRVITGDSRVFKSKEINNTTDVDVTLLVDASGSMHHNKRFLQAASCSILMTEVLNSLNINHEILSFTDEDRTPIQIINKPFGKKVIKSDLVDQFCKLENILCENSDGESILWAYNRLLKQRGKRKILIVFSDGQPSSDISGIAQFTKDVTGSIEKSNVELYGIGIESESVSQFYKDFTVIKDVSNLESALFNVIQKKLIKGA